MGVAPHYNPARGRSERGVEAVGRSLLRVGDESHVGILASDHLGCCGGVRPVGHDYFHRAGVVLREYRVEGGRDGCFCVASRNDHGYEGELEGTPRIASTVGGRFDFFGAGCVHAHGGGLIAVLCRVGGESLRPARFVSGDAGCQNTKGSACNDVDVREERATRQVVEVQPQGIGQHCAQVILLHVCAGLF